MWYGEKSLTDTWLLRNVSIFLRPLFESVIVDVTEAVSDSQDAKDNKFLELAVSGNATAIISGDPDLLVLHPFRGIPIIAPHVFVSEP